MSSKNDTADDLDPEVVQKLNELGADGIDDLVPANATRRQALSAIGGALLGGAAAGTAGAATSPDPGQQSISVGANALNLASHVAGNLYSGPGAGISEVNPEKGRWYIETDAGSGGNLWRLHYADGSSWSANGWKMPETTTEDAVVNQSLTIGFDALELGDGANANGPTANVALGKDATADINNAGGAIAVGAGASALSNSTVAVGDNADAQTYNATAVGSGATASGRDSVALGRESSVQAQSIAIGEFASANASGAFVVGSDEIVSTANVGRIGVDQLVYGGTRDTIADADLNNGELTVELDETNSAFRLRGKDSGGTVREATIAW